jgi:hypothetical protein
MMTMRVIAAVALVLHVIPVPVGAVTLSGVMIYSADHYGNPNAWNAQKEDFAFGQVWRTQLGGDWYGLGLLAGLPPANSDGPVLNAPNFGIQIPLVEGENDFTVVGEPSSLTRHEDFSHFALNLYFDGVLDRPGISVLFPRYSPRRGSPPLPNVAPVMYALSLAGVKAAAESTYTDGVDRVSVSAISFLPPEKFGVDFDKVSAHAVLPSSVSSGPNAGGADGLGGFDFVGVLRIHVEGPGNAAVPGAVSLPAAPVVMQGVTVGTNILGEAEAAAGAVRDDLPTEQGRGSSGSAAGAPVPDAAATPSAAQTPTPVGSVLHAATTPTLAPTAAATGTAAKPPVTPTPAATYGSLTPSPGQTPTSPSASPGRTPSREEPTVPPGGPKAR